VLANLEDMSSFIFLHRRTGFYPSEAQRSKPHLLQFGNIHNKQCVPRFWSRAW